MTFKKIYNVNQIYVKITFHQNNNDLTKIFLVHQCTLSSLGVLKFLVWLPSLETLELHKLQMAA